MKKTIGTLIVIAVALFGVHIVHAHEVYVLDKAEIAQGIAAARPDFLDTIRDNHAAFFCWGALTFGIIALAFFISIIRPFERALDPLYKKLKTAAPIIAQVTLGISLVASGYYKAIFGPELPMHDIFGVATPYLSVCIMIIGGMLLVGLLPRISAFLVTIIFAILCVHYKTYMLNYGTYLGEALTVLLFGGGYHLLKHDALGARIKRIEQKLLPHLHKYKFLIMRILFGASLAYASLYAKFFHGALAFETVTKYHLTNYFHFDPMFLVLGAMTIKVLLGLFFIFGFEIRFASLFFLAFLTMSLVFFGEVVWPHLILIGTAFVMFAHGYDEYSVSTWISHKFRKQKELEPVL